MSAVIFFSGIIVPDFNERLYREATSVCGLAICANEEKLTSRKNVIRGIGLDLIVNFKELKVVQKTEKSNPVKDLREVRKNDY